jgi:large subunit ribosomal protein L7/L12
MPGGEGLAMAKDRDEDERYDVILVRLGERKINVIKAVRETLGLGLAEAKDFVENVPQAVKRDVSRDEAEYLKRRFEQEDAWIRLEKLGSP